MSEITRETVYFKEPGEQNTEGVLNRVKSYADREGITDIVIASSTGETGAKAAKILKG